MIINNAMDIFMNNLTSGQIALLLEKLGHDVVEYSNFDVCEQYPDYIVYRYEVEFNDGNGIVMVSFKVYDCDEIKVDID